MAAQPPPNINTPPRRGGRAGLGIWLGVAALGAVGYYMYSSGGDARKAGHQAQSDARKLRERGLDGAENVGAKIDRGFDDAKHAVSDSYRQTYDEVRAEAGKQGRKLESYVDKFDARVEEKAREAKEKLNKSFK